MTPRFATIGLMGRLADPHVLEMVGRLAKELQAAKAPVDEKVKSLTQALEQSRQEAQPQGLESEKVEAEQKTELLTESADQGTSHRDNSEQSIHGERKGTVRGFLNKLLHKREGHAVEPETQPTQAAANNNRKRQPRTLAGRKRPRPSSCERCSG